MWDNSWKKKTMLHHYVGKSDIYVLFLSDRVGFEPTIPVKVLRISSAVPSTTRPPVRVAAPLLNLNPDGKNLHFRPSCGAVQSSPPASQRMSNCASDDSNGARMASEACIARAKPNGGLTIINPAAVSRSLAPPPASAPMSTSMRSTLFAPAESTAPPKAWAPPADLSGNHRR